MNHANERDDPRGFEQEWWAARTLEAQQAGKPIAQVIQERRERIFGKGVDFSRPAPDGLLDYDETDSTLPEHTFGGQL